MTELRRLMSSRYSVIDENAGMTCGQTLVIRFCSLLAPVAVTAPRGCSGTCSIASA
jgi:hypothetical protein